MQLEVDSDLKKAFLACVSRAYNGKVEEGILDLFFDHLLSGRAFCAFDINSH